MKLEKKYIILIVAILVSILIIIIGRFKKDNTQERLLNIITNKGFVQDTGTMYALDSDKYPLNKCKNTNNDCFGETYYFDVSDYKLIKEETLISDGVRFEFTPTYDYKTSELTYFYRVYYQNGAVIIKGDYVNKDFKCNVEYAYGIKVNNKSNYCNNLENKVKEFNSYSLMFLTDSEILNKIHKISS